MTCWFCLEVLEMSVSEVIDSVHESLLIGVLRWWMIASLGFTGITSQFWGTCGSPGLGPMDIGYYSTVWVAMWWTGTSITEGFMGVIDPIDGVLPGLVIIWGACGNQLMTPFGTQVLSSTVGYRDLGACADPLVFRAWWELQKRRDKFEFSSLTEGGGLCSLHRMYTELHRSSVYAQVAWSLLSQSTLKVAGTTVFIVILPWIEYQMAQ